MRYLVIGDAPKPLSHTEQVRPPADPVRVDFRRSLKKKWLQIARQLFQLVIDTDKCLSVLCRNLAEFVFRPLTIRPPRNHLSIRKRNLNCRIAGNHPQPKFTQPQIGDHLRPQHACNVGSSRGAAARKDFFRDATTADNFPPLQHQRREAGSRQISGGRQSVVAASDHDRVVDFLRRRHR